jgi:hypothetical protein
MACPACPRVFVGARDKDRTRYFLSEKAPSALGADFHQRGLFKAAGEERVNRERDERGNAVSG